MADEDAVAKIVIPLISQTIPMKLKKFHSKKKKNFMSRKHPNLVQKSSPKTGPFMDVQGT